MFPKREALLMESVPVVFCIPLFEKLSRSRLVLELCNIQNWSRSVYFWMTVCSKEPQMQAAQVQSVTSD